MSNELKLGTRCEAQQIVLAQDISHFRSWRDVDAKIKEVERELIARRKSA